MRTLKKRAQIYILGIILAGLILVTSILQTERWQNPWMVLGLSGLASFALIFKVEGSTRRSHYNFSFIVYAFAFIEIGLENTILIVILSNLAEWIWYKYIWYIPIFNALSLSIVFYLASLFHTLLQAVLPLSALSSIAAVVLVFALITCGNHLMIGLVIWFSHNENFQKSGVLEFFPIMLDFTLLCLGAATAMLWDRNPYSVVLALLPLYLFYSTLKVPALERKTEIDPKTGLFNASYFSRVLDTEIKRSNRFNRPLTVVMADLDLLRNINNTYGHIAGDDVLIGVATILKNSVREYDVVARFGGEEFVIMMPETMAEDIVSHIETIRRKIELAEFPVDTSDTPIKATMSFGIAGRERTEQTYKELLHNADAALYHSKLNGRNRVYIYTETGYQELFKPPLS